jgi:hypothetical protein
MSHPSRINGYARLSAQQNPDVAGSWTLAHHLCSPLCPPNASERERWSVADQPEEQCHRMTSRRRATLTQGWACHHRALVWQHPKPEAWASQTLGLTLTSGRARGPLHRLWRGRIQWRRAQVESRGPVFLRCMLGFQNLGILFISHSIWFLFSLIWILFYSFLW